jgi:hypothetical protein
MHRPDETWHRLLNWTYGQAPSERLAAQILLDQGFTDLDPSHPLGGKDGGKDAVCLKDGQKWLMAVYFPRGQHSVGQIQSKFEADFVGVAKNAVAGIAFVTNQELTLGERAQLAAVCGPVALDIFHLERIATILDQPRMASVRQQFLYIESVAAKPKTGFVLPVGWGSVQTGQIIDGYVEVGPLRLAAQGKIQTQAKAGVEGFLTWQSRIPAQLYGRDAEMADLYRWVTGGEVDPRVRLLHGMGGIGKTRLAVELGDRLRAEGWGVCLVGSPMHAHAFAQGEQGNLLLIDYPELYPDALSSLLTWMRSGHLPPGRWRILLLSRDERLAQTVDQVASGWRDDSLKLVPLSDAEAAWQLFAAASLQMQQAMAGSVAENPSLLTRDRFEHWLAQNTHHQDPLIILAFALNLQYQPEAFFLGHVQILQVLVQHEMRRMEKGLSQFGRAQQRTMLLLKGLAALTGGLRRSDIKALRAANLPAEGLVWPELPDLQESPLWQGDHMPEIQPDRLAAYFLQQVVNQYIPDEAGEWLWQCLLLGEADKDLLRTRLGRLARLAWDYAWQNGVGFGLAAAIVPDAAQAERLELLFESNVALELPLGKLVLQVGRLRLDYWEKQAAQDFAAAAQQLATRLNNHSLRLAAVGQRAEALACIARAVQIYEELARQNFAAYGPALAPSLNNWSIRLAAAGQRAEALACMARAVQIYEELARQKFAAYGPDLARGLNNWSLHLAEAGQRADALASIARAVQIYEELARQNFAAYGPELATSLNNWSLRLAGAGQRADALASIERAVQIYEDLSRQNFSAYGADLATSLSNWSNHLAEAGQRAEALVSMARAVQIHEELARQNFAAYGPDLASSLNNWSNRLAAAGQRAKALASIERSVQIREELARQNFAAYGSDLAQSLNNWSVRLAEAGQWAEALASIERAVQIWEELARQNFAAYGPDLAMGLNNLAVYLAEAGQRAEALASIERAVQIREELARQTPAVYDPELAGSLAILAGLSPSSAAITHLQRALTLITPYALPGTTYEQWREGMEQTLQARQAETPPEA